MMVANISTATGARRRKLTDRHHQQPTAKLEYFPTQPWAARALVEEVGFDVRGKRVWEPNCGEGDLALALAEYEPVRLYATDVFDYGFGGVADFHDCPAPGPVDMIVMNPPFKAAATFFQRAMSIATEGVAMLIRAQWLEPLSGRGAIFDRNMIREIWAFTDRLSLVPGCLDPDARLSTMYVWLIACPNPCTWSGRPTFHWIPTCRARLERRSDYERRRPWSNRLPAGPLFSPTSSDRK